MKRNMLVFCVMTLALAFGFSIAGADKKMYPGSMAVKIIASDPAPKYSGFSSIYNPSSKKSLRVQLPLVRDAGGIKSAWVQAVDQNYSKNFTARLVTSYRKGNSFSSYLSPIKRTSGAKKSHQYMKFGSAPAKTTQTIYFIRCEIPPSYSGNHSSITAYGVEEKK